MNKYPMARILFPFMGGILVAPFLPSNILLWLIILVGIFLAFIIWIFIPSKYRIYKRRWVNGLLLTFLFFVLAIIGTWYNSPSNSPNNYRKFSDPKAFLIEINSPFTETAKTNKCLGIVKAVYFEKDSSWKTTNGKIILYFQKQDEFSLNYGDKIISTAKLNQIQGVQNPYAFDYGLYMQRRGIFDQSFIKENEWKLFSSNHLFSFQGLAIQFRSKLLSILNSLQFDKDNFAVAAALLIGYDEYLDDDLRARFAGSGAMHILCVSGLHVGIIFMLSNFLFGFLGKIKYGNVLKTGLILAIIWFYALITGLSPSVMRAATMFTFIALGNSFSRKSNTYNSLAASALLLLLIDPNLIYNIGFQLSYSAVFAILYVQPKIFQLFIIKNAILSKIWGLIGVSIAAQMGTFPLAVYYFHQFPNYFLLTNLWVIPLAFIIVSGGIFVLIIGLIGLTTSFFGTIASSLLNFSLIGLNKGVEIINLLPYAISNNLLLSKYEVLILYVLIFSLSNLLLYKKHTWLIPALSSVFLLVASSIMFQTSNLNSSSWTVYKTNGYSAMDFIAQQKSVLFGDSAFVSDQQIQKFILNENHVNNQIKERVFIYKTPTNSSYLDALVFRKNIILFHSLRILYLDKAEKKQSFKKPLPIDYVVIAKNANVNLSQLLKQYCFKTIIFDSSNNWWRINQLKLDAEALGLSYWDVNEKGAFVFSNKKPPDKNQRA